MVPGVRGVVHGCVRIDDLWGVHPRSSWDPLPPPCSGVGFELGNHVRHRKPAEGVPAPAATWPLSRRSLLPSCRRSGTRSSSPRWVQRVRRGCSRCQPANRASGASRHRPVHLIGISSEWRDAVTSHSSPRPRSANELQGHGRRLRSERTGARREGLGKEDVDCHEKRPEAVHRLQVGGSQVGEGRLSADCRRGDQKASCAVCDVARRTTTQERVPLLHVAAGLDGI